MTSLANNIIDKIEQKRAKEQNQIFHKSDLKGLAAVDDRAIDIALGILNNNPDMYCDGGCLFDKDGKQLTTPHMPYSKKRYIFIALSGSTFSQELVPLVDKIVSSYCNRLSNEWLKISPSIYYNLKTCSFSRTNPNQVSAENTA